MKPFCITPVSTNKKNVFISDFNNHSTTWGYDRANSNGEGMKQWSEPQNSNIIYDAKLPTLFNSGRWKKKTATQIWLL